MMTECETYHELISALIDGELDPSESKLVQVHLDECDRCQELKDEFNQSDRLFKSHYDTAMQAEHTSIDGHESTAKSKARQLFLESQRQDSQFTKNQAPNLLMKPGTAANGFASENITETSQSAQQTFAKPGHLEKTGPSGFRLVRVLPWAIAASALIASFVMSVQRNNEPDSVPAIEPILALQTINTYSHRDQQTMLKTLEWDLRMMKLEMKQLDLSPDQSELMEKHIGQLMFRIEQLKSQP